MWGLYTKLEFGFRDNYLDSGEPNGKDMEQEMERGFFLEAL